MGGISALLLLLHWASCLGLMSTENWQTAASNALMLCLAFGIPDHIIIGWHNWDKAWFSKALAPLIRCASVRLITVVYQKQHAFHPPCILGGRRWKPERVVSLPFPSPRSTTNTRVTPRENDFDSSSVSAHHDSPVALLIKREIQIVSTVATERAR